MSDDFTMLSQAAAAKGVGKGDGPSPAKVARQDAGGPRAYLKCFETLAPQMLNAYGEAKYAKMADEDVWKHMSTELKSGAMWMTEYAAIDPERRGTATNRWLQVQIAFCQQQKSASQRQKNAFVMLPDKLACLYDEIDRILPSLEYCLAPKKASPKTGSSALRSGVADTETSSSAKEPSDLTGVPKSYTTGWTSRQPLVFVWCRHGMRVAGFLLWHRRITVLRNVSCITVTVCIRPLLITT